MRSVLIIAEAGVNHNGDLDLALEMVHKAKDAGADIVKFQTAKAENVISRYAEKAEYQKESTGANESQLDMIKKIMLPFEAFKIIQEECIKTGIQFLSTPFDLEAIDYLAGMGMDVWKVPSGEITNLPYLVKIAHFGQKVIMSTGMANMAEIEDAIGILKNNGTSDITLLHCSTQYPTPFCDTNLRAMVTMRDAFGLPVGYSDHTLGMTVPIAATALGAAVIEKHFTLDKNMPGPDHKASLEPDELKAMVKAIRDVEQIMGDGNKIPSEEEIKNRLAARKSIVAKCVIKKGDIFSTENITVKRPGNGISPMMWDEIIGTKAIRDFDEDEPIQI